MPGLLWSGLRWANSVEGDSVIGSAVGLSLKSLKGDNFSLPLESMFGGASLGLFHFLLLDLGEFFRLDLEDGTLGGCLTLASFLSLLRPCSSCFFVLLPCLVKFLIHQSSNSATSIYSKQKAWRKITIGILYVNK